MPLNSSCSPLNNLSDWELDEAVSIKLRGTGFNTLRGFSRTRLNLAILEGLIQTYDYTGHRFNLGFGHITFGLEDVLYLTGLPIDGEPVTGLDPTDTNTICQQYLGKSEGYGVKSQIKLRWLKDNFMSVPEDCKTDERLDFYVRAYVLFVIGCTFAPCAGGKSVSSMFLPLLANVAEIRQYAWGAAYLACLHEDMEKVKEHGKKVACGFYYPLLVFAYMRFPRLLCGRCIDHGVSDKFPLAVNWSHALFDKKVMSDSYTAHNVDALINFFVDDLKNDEDVVWQPYGELPAEFLPLHLRDQLPLRTSLTVLLCFEKAVYHRPDMCQRQLGLEGLEEDKGKLMIIKTKQRTGAKSDIGTDWRTKPPYDRLIPVWKARRSLLIDRDAPVIRDRKRKNTSFFVPEEQPIHFFEPLVFESPPRRKSARQRRS